MPSLSVSYDFYVRAGNQIGYSKPSLTATGEPEEDKIIIPTLPTKNRIPNSAITKVTMESPGNISAEYEGTSSAVFQLTVMALSAGERERLSGGIGALPGVGTQLTTAEGSPVQLRRGRQGHLHGGGKDRVFAGYHPG